jgi:hypothetical protein
MKMTRRMVSLSKRRKDGIWGKACADWRADLAWVEAKWLDAPVPVPVPVTPVTPS